MLRGEFESMLLVHSVVPGHAVKPVGWGACSSRPDHYFYISEFHNLSTEQPDITAFCSMAAQLHTVSADLFERDGVRPKPGGRFGFHLVTHMGKFPQDNSWADSWETLYTRGMHRIFSYETAAQGRSEELDSLTVDLLGKVIPRLLRPLETCGERIRPSLLHGDLQIRNVKTDKDDLKPIFFDAGSFWGHNECESSLPDLRRYPEKVEASMSWDRG